METTEAVTTGAAPVYRTDPETDELAKKWNQRIAHGREHWEKFHQRVRHNRKTVAGFDWSADVKSREFYKPRANLIHGTITAILPQIYARNPEISASATHKARKLKLFCQTIQTVTNRALEDADLKGRAKATVRSALTSSFGIVKVMYQRDMIDDPHIKARIEDAQDNIRTVEALLADIEDPDQRGELDAKKLELEQTMAGLSEQVEVVASEGLVIDRVLTDNLLIDPAVAEFWDYRQADWIAQVIPMKLSAAQAAYKMKLAGAKAYAPHEQPKVATGTRLGAGMTGIADEDRQIAILEIWDHVSQRIYTMAEGCDYWLRPPYSPKKAGERWYPFFLLPFNVVDGQFVGPSMVDLTEKLQNEHNDARDKFNGHRDLCRPGWIAGADITEKSITRYTDSSVGEITIIDTEGKPLQSVIQPRQHPPIDPQVYDTSGVRYDWEQVTGLQDAARGSVVEPKTATEAKIMAQSLSGRVSEFRDQVEDWLQELSRYAAQILLMEYTPQQVERIMGEPGVKQIATPMGMVDVPDPQYDWPQLSRDEIFGMIEMKIRPGTTGAPDRKEQQESWGAVLPVLQGLITQILQVRASGMDPTPLVNLLRETLVRFDERMEVEDFIPQAPQPMTMPGMPPPGMLPPGAQAPPPPTLQ